MGITGEVLRFESNNEASASCCYPFERQMLVCPWTQGEIKAQPQDDQVTLENQLCIMN